MMKAPATATQTTRQRGVALLIAIFALVLISGVGVAMVAMSGTETAITANYRASTQAFYASFAGLEEGRGRLWTNHPVNQDLTQQLVSALGTLDLNTVVYITNPLGGEVVNPADLSEQNPYRDVEYQLEFGVPVTNKTVNLRTSTSTMAGIVGPLFKWVRVNAKTEQSSGIDVNGDAILDNTLPIYYDGQNQFLFDAMNPLPGNQVFSVTSLAVLPNGSRKILQYDVSRLTFNLELPAAVTLNGEGSDYDPVANAAVHDVTGNDQGGCLAEPLDGRPAIGTSDPDDATNIANGIPKHVQQNYTGAGGTPSVEEVDLSATYDDPALLQELLDNIEENADYVLTGPADNTDMNFGSSSNPLITYVDGDLTLSGNPSGYGLLVVTGNLAFSGTVSWNGIILVIGDGEMQINGSGAGIINGAIFVSKIYDENGNLLPTLGASSYGVDGGGTAGINYDSCSINNAQNNVRYRVLSFREIPE